MTLEMRIQDLLDRAIANGEIAGANLLVLQNGKELAYVQAGFANIEDNIPYQRDTITRLYSMTKPVTAAAAMILLEKGLLDFGQSVGDILPEFCHLQVWEDEKKIPAKRNILVKDLLNMTSGLSYPGEDSAGQCSARIFEDINSRMFTDHPVTTMEFAQRMGHSGLSFHPGQKWMYGSSADVLGAVIEAVSGMKFGEFLEKELFAPLGMSDTGFYVPEKHRNRLADVYESHKNGAKLYKTYNLGIRYEMDSPPAFESGGAGLVSTIDDYAKFARMLLEGGIYKGIRILSESSVKFLTNSKLTPWQQESVWTSWESMYGYGYSNLMRIMEEPGMALFKTWKGEYGWDGWLGCYFCNSPSNGVTILLTCQRKDAGTMVLTRYIRNIIADYIP